MVWITALVFFQTALFVGYLYAHLLSFLEVKWQKAIHLALLALSLFTLPIAINPEFTLDPSKPFSQLTLLLLLSIGLPYLLLASTSPLLQYWIAQKKEKNPYKLYAISNAASVAALLAYPLFFEPVFRLSTQSSFWSLTFIFFSLSVLLISLDIPNTKKAKTTKHSKQPKVLHYLRWMTYPAIASILLVAITNQISLDIASTPLIWILPLLIYLVTFIITFHDAFWYKRTLLYVLFLASLILYIGLGLSGGDLFITIVTHLLVLFTGAMICHGELVLSKPENDWLTNFYLALSAGGAIGGIFAGLIAPQIFTIFWELPLALVGIGLVIICTSLLNKDLRSVLRTKKWQTVGCGVLLIGFLFVVYADTKDYASDAIHVRRNFYGVLKVSEDIDNEGEPYKQLLHGSTLHGLQYTPDLLTNRITTYYGQETPIGRIITQTTTGSSFHLGVIGLGTGTLAQYGENDDTISFYEIDPDIIEIADEYFSFLKSFPGDLNVFEGDARITLQNQAPQGFDILVVDAFSSDAIPTHLLTKEAMAIYLTHMNEGGIIAFHISNRHLDLEPVVGALGQEYGLNTAFMTSLDERPEYVYSSSWVVLSSQPLPPELETQEIRYATELWTDDYSNLLTIIY